MNEPEYYMFPLHDPNFSVQSIEDYKTLIGFIFRTASELAFEYPDKKILVTYPVGESDGS